MAAPQGRRGDVPDAVFFGVFVAIPASVAVVWLAAQLSTLATRGEPARVSLAGTARAVLQLPGHAGDPATAWEEPTNLPGPVPFWIAAGLVLIVMVAVATWGAVKVAGRRGRPGMAGRAGLDPVRARAVLQRTAVLRPDLADESRDRQLDGAGVALGRHGQHGPVLWGTIEDSYAVLAPPRTGKTARLVIPTVLEHDGPAVVTSTRWEVVRLCAAARAKRGPVWVFATDQRATVPPGVERARWSPVAGAEDPQTAMVRARSFARAAGAAEGISGSEFWATHAERVLRCYLHAAALDGQTIGDVRRWCDDPTDGEPVRILRRQDAADGWAGELAALARVADRQRDGVWGVAQQSLAALADPRLRDACAPTEGTDLDPRELLESNGTLFVVGTAETQDVIAPLVAALVEAVTGTARSLAAETATGQLSPSLLLALDEAANIAPLPTLPTLLAEGGGTGITTMVVLQSRAQARARWGEEAADAILAACTHRVILGGGGELSELEDLTRLIGERDEEVRSHSWSPWGAGTNSGGGAQTSSSLRRIPILTPADLQAMDKGTGVLCSPGMRPALVWLPAWWDRRDADQLRNPTHDPPDQEAATEGDTDDDQRL